MVSALLIAEVFGVWTGTCGNLAPKLSLEPIDPKLPRANTPLKTLKP